MQDAASRQASSIRLAQETAFGESHFNSMPLQLLNGRLLIALWAAGARTAVDQGTDTNSSKTSIAQRLDDVGKVEGVGHDHHALLCHFQRLQPRCSRLEGVAHLHEVARMLVERRPQGRSLALQLLALLLEGAQPLLDLSAAGALSAGLPCRSTRFAQHVGEGPTRGRTSSARRRTRATQGTLRLQGP